MKKLIAVMMSVFMLLLTVFSTPVKAESTYTLTVETPVTVTISTGYDFAWCDFSPAESGFYRFWSSDTNSDPKATLYDPDYNEILTNDDALNPHFLIEAYLEKGQVYHLKAYLYSSKTGYYTVHVEQFTKYADVKKGSIYVKVNKAAKMEVVGSCLNDPNATYTWYKQTRNMKNLETDWKKLSNTNATYSISKVTKTSHYICVVNEGGENEISLAFWVIIDNDFDIDAKKYVFFIQSKDKVKLEVLTYGNDLSGVNYYWYKCNENATSVDEYIKQVKVTSSPSLTVTPTWSEVDEYICYAVDKYGNGSGEEFYIVPVKKSIFVNSSVSFANNTDAYSGEDLFFVAPEDGIYTFYSTGNSDTYGSLYSIGGDGEIADGDSGEGSNFMFSATLRAGTTYILSATYSPQSSGTIVVEGPEYTAPLAAGNTGKGIEVTWLKADGVKKVKVYRRLAGSASWTEVTSSTKTFYEDTASMKMGKTYEYAIKTYDGSSWSGYSPIASVVRNPFTDINEEYTCFDAVSWAYNSKVVNGVTAQRFDPYAPVQRQHFAIMLWRFAGKPSASGTNKFTDIGSCNATAKSAILWASGKGIIKGYKDKTFKPKDYVTREQILIILHRFASKFAGKKAAAVTEEMIQNLYDSCYDDFDALNCNPASINAMAWALDKGLLEKATYYEEEAGKYYVLPKDPCNRGDLCIFLQNFNSKIKKYK